VAGEEAADRPVANRYAFVGERLAQFFDRDVRRRFDKAEDRVPVRLDPSGSPVSTRQRLTLAALTSSRSLTPKTWRWSAASPSIWPAPEKDALKNRPKNRRIEHERPQTILYHRSLIRTHWPFS
jgi:hypothetical protein